jgi:hypothetical protein
MKGEKPNKSEETCPSATLPTTNPTWTDPGVNPGLRGERQATNRLSNVTACLYLSTWLFWGSALNWALCINLNTFELSELNIDILYGYSRYVAGTAFGSQSIKVFYSSVWKSTCVTTHTSEQAVVMFTLSSYQGVLLDLRQMIRLYTTGSTVQKCNTDGTNFRHQSHNV